MRCPSRRYLLSIRWYLDCFVPSGEVKKDAHSELEFVPL